MSSFVESLKRLFLLGKIKEEKVAALFDEGKINKDELDFIRGDGM